MRVLLDEQLPRQLAPCLIGHEVRTVEQQSWAGPLELATGPARGTRVQSRAPRAQSIFVGSTDRYGYPAEENPKSMYELHATIQHLLGLDFEKLTYRFNGRDMRLTDVHGSVIREILA